MKLRNLKALAIAGAAAIVPLSMLAGGVASADPVGAPQFRAVSGVGSDTSEEVMQALSELVKDDSGTKLIGSYSANGGAFSTKASGCDYAAYAGTNGAGIRANGSGAGRSRLIEALTPGNAKFGCLQFARSSSLTLTSTGVAGVQLAYIPFAADNITYAKRADSSISGALSRSALVTIYNCAFPNAGTAAATFKPLIPQAGSGTRTAWLAALGLSATPASCVSDTYVSPNDGVTRNVQEHNGASLINKQNIVPYSAAQYEAQVTQVINDVHGNAVLGSIDGIPALAANTGVTSNFRRDLYNVIDNDAVNNPTLSSVFVGKNSKVCQQSAAISKLGLTPVGECGTVSVTAP